jgi:hypothetical protein
MTTFHRPEWTTTGVQNTQPPAPVEPLSPKEALDNALTRLETEIATLDQLTEKQDTNEKGHAVTEEGLKAFDASEIDPDSPDALQQLKAQRDALVDLQAHRELAIRSRAKLAERITAQRKVVVAAGMEMYAAYSKVYGVASRRLYDEGKAFVAEHFERAPMEMWDLYKPYVALNMAKWGHPGMIQDEISKVNVFRQARSKVERLLAHVREEWL